MLFIYKGRGILIPVYVIVSFVVVAMISGALKRNVGGIFAYDYHMCLVLGPGIILSSIWTYLTSHDYIKTDGIKKKIDLGNSFFYIKMNIFSYILLASGIILTLVGIYKTFYNISS